MSEFRLYKKQLKRSAPDGTEVDIEVSLQPNWSVERSLDGKRICLMSVVCTSENLPVSIPDSERTQNFEINQNEFDGIEIEGNRKSYLAELIQRNIDASMNHWFKKTGPASIFEADLVSLEFTLDRVSTSPNPGL